MNFKNSSEQAPTVTAPVASSVTSVLPKDDDFLQFFCRQISVFINKAATKFTIIVLLLIKVHSITDHEGPELDQRYSPTLSLTSALYGGGWSMSRPGRFTPGKDPVPIV